MIKNILRVFIFLSLLLLAVIAGEIRAKISSIEEILKERYPKQYQVTSKFVIVNPCDLWDIKMEAMIEKSLD